MYPMKQTGQMVLEEKLLQNPQFKGFFCQTTSYRFEEHPKPGRHNVIFPMAEFEIHGDLDTLMQFEREMLEHFGFGKAESFPTADYLDICKKYGVPDGGELTHEHEEWLKRDFGPVFFLKNFPEVTSPFWNMKRDPKTGLAKKCDVILNGIETIGSAERSCNVKEMRERFYSIMKGQYAKDLFEFGKERVEKELEEFFSYNFIERSGAGIGVGRMIAACKAQNLIPPPPKTILQ
jgi:aspartyl/asparaginyl-tRNA synthetase